MNWLEWIGLLNLVVYGTIGAYLVIIGIVTYIVGMNKDFVKALFLYYRNYLIEKRKTRLKGAEDAVEE